MRKLIPSMKYRLGSIAIVHLQRLLVKNVFKYVILGTEERDVSWRQELISIYR